MIGVPLARVVSPAELNVDYRKTGRSFLCFFTLFSYGFFFCPVIVHCICLKNSKTLCETIFIARKFLGCVHIVHGSNGKESLIAPNSIQTTAMAHAF
jgi:hypothetical protein